MSQNPFKELSLRFPGFTPIVESDATGATLIRLPEQSLVLPGELTRRGTLVLGLPGSGKTTRFLERGVTSALSHPEASVVVFAVQPGSAKQARAAFEHLRPGSRVRPAHFNPGDAAACTHCINPIAGVRTKSEAMAIGQTLGQPAHSATTSPDADYFLQQATTMIGHAILAVNGLHRGKGTLAMIRDAIDGGPSALRALGEAGGSTELARFANEILEGNRNSETTLAQISNCLQWLFYEQTRASTSSQELDFDRLLIKQPGLLVLAVNEEEIPRQRALISLIFRQLFTWIISAGRRHGGPLPRPLYIFIDELPAAGRIPDFGLRLTATFRKSNVSVVCAAQCEAQIVDVYGQESAAVLAGFGSRIYVPPIDFADAERASGRSGIIEASSTTTTADGQPLTSTPFLRPLLLPGEIATPPRDAQLGPRILFRLAELPPFFGHLRASWQLPEESAINTRAASLEIPRRRRRPSTTAPKAKTPPPDAAAAAYQGWSKERMNRQYREALEAIRLPTASSNATAWWRALERDHADRPHEILWMAEQMAARKTTLDVFFRSSVYASTEDFQAMLHYFDYSQRKKQFEEARRDARFGEKRAPTDTDAGTPAENHEEGEESPRHGDGAGPDGDEEDFLMFLEAEEHEDEHEHEHEDEDEDEDEEDEEDDLGDGDRVPF